MNKLIRDGKIAVLVSPGYGAGWYSWHGIKEMLFDPKIIEILENPDDDDAVTSILNYCHQKYGEDEYFGGVDELTVIWVDQGRKFIIEEYDGAETIKFEDEIRWIEA